jgi:hypothetical protein
MKSYLFSDEWIVTNYKILSRISQPFRSTCPEFLSKTYCKKKRLKIPKDVNQRKKDRQYNGRRKKDQTIIYKTLH